jgi:CCR4-NOT transcriptional regulation complex NOT5 subunit
MLDPHREIQTLIDSFVDRLSEIAKRIALEQLKQAFGTVKLPPVRSSHSSSSMASSSLSSLSSLSSSADVAQRARARRGQREIEALRGKLMTVISDNPGCRAEDINSALGTRTPQIAQPLRRLVAEQLVRTEGARRGTRYFSVAPVEAQSSRRPPPSPPPEPATVEEPVMA